MHLLMMLERPCEVISVLLLTLPFSYLIHQCKLWKKMYSSDNVVLRSLSRFAYNAFTVLGSIMRFSHLMFQIMQLRAQYESFATSVNL